MYVFRKLVENYWQNFCFVADSQFLIVYLEKWIHLEDRHLFRKCFYLPCHKNPFLKGFFLLGKPTGSHKNCLHHKIVPGPSRQYTWRRGDAVNEELDSMSGTHDLRYDRRKSPSPRPQEMGSRTPEKRVRSASPGPAAPSISIDTRSDKGKFFFCFCFRFFVYMK